LTLPPSTLLSILVILAFSVPPRRRKRRFLISQFRLIVLIHFDFTAVYSSPDSRCFGFFCSSTPPQTPLPYLLNLVDCSYLFLLRRRLRFSRFSIFWFFLFLLAIAKAAPLSPFVGGLFLSIFYFTAVYAHPNSRPFGFFLFLPTAANAVPLSPFFG
jgi:hypothetical protein